MKSLRKKFIFQFSGVLFMVELVIFCFASSCCNTIPVVTTSQATEIGRTTALCGGVVTDDGGGVCDCSDNGVCWSTNPLPTIADNRIKDTDSLSIGPFTSRLTQLTENTLYYVRAYATNAQGTAYGNEISFTTKSITKATLSTKSISQLDPVSATSGGDITDDGGSAIISKGVCWGTGENPDLTNKTDDGTGGDGYTSYISGLLPDNDYHVRAYAINGVGTSFGNNIPFRTPCAKPLAVTNYETFGQTSVTFNGNVSPVYSITSVTFEYGTNASGLDKTVTAAQSPVTGNNTVAVSAVVAFSELSLDVEHYYRVKAVSCGGTHYGNIEPFIPSVTDQYTLTITVVPERKGSVVKLPDQSHYFAGTDVKLTAYGANDYSFIGWGGDVTGTSNPITVTMNGNKNVTASFFYTGVGR